MGPEPDEVDEIRRQIDESRANLGSAVGALAYKADVKNRGKEAIQDKKEALMEKVDEVKGKVTGGDGDGGGGMAEKIKGKLPDPGQIKDKLPDGDAIKGKLPDAEQIKDKVPDGVGDAAGKASGIAHDHPVAVTAGAAAAGLVAGLALPQTDLEREKIGPTAQHARAQVQDRVQETVAQVKHGVQDAVGSVTDAVKDTGEEHGGKVGDIAAKAADKAQEKVAPES